MTSTLHNRENLIVRTLLIIILILAVSVRFNALDKHFAHVDDLVVTTKVLETHQSSASEMLEKIEVNRPVVRKVEPIFTGLYPLIRSVISAMNVAQWTTYAPGQFVLTSLFINNSSSYGQRLFWSRFASFFIACISMLVLWKTFRVPYGKESAPYAIVGLSILAFSWEHIIYSVQSETYVIGLLAVLISFRLFFYCLKKQHLNLKTSVGVGLILGFLIFLNYQFLFFIPGFFLALLISQKNHLSDFIKSYLPAGVVLGVLFLIIYKLFLANVAHMGVNNWNAGPNQEFIFSIPTDAGFLGAVIYSIKFFVSNLFIVFNFLVGFAHNYPILNNILAILLLGFFLVGVISYHKSQDPNRKFFSRLFYTTCLVWTILVIWQKVSLSPTRHSLILISFIIIFVPEGLKFLASKINFVKTHFFKFALAIPTVIAVLFFSDYSREMNSRRDPFNPDKIESLITEYNISDIYAYGFTYNLNLMSYIEENFTKQPDIGYSLVYKSKASHNSKNALFISHRDWPLDDKVIEAHINKDGVHTAINTTNLFQEEIKSTKEIDFGDLTKNGTNSLYINILQIEQEN